MREAVIVSSVRTAVGKALKGTLRQVRPDDMAATAIEGALAEGSTWLAGAPVPQTKVRGNLGSIFGSDRWQANGPQKNCIALACGFLASGLNVRPVIAIVSCTCLDLPVGERGRAGLF